MNVAGGVRGTENRFLEQAVRALSLLLFLCPIFPIDLPFYHVNQVRRRRKSL